jgi:hypothetical protein
MLISFSLKSLEEIELSYLGAPPHNISIYENGIIDDKVFSVITRLQSLKSETLLQIRKKTNFEMKRHDYDLAKGASYPSKKIWKV